MTRMPRFGTRHSKTERADFFRSRAVAGVLALWHGACCFLFATGCIYLGPITLLEDENVPPEIVGITSDPLCEPDDTGLVDALCVSYDDYLVFVIASDLNEDALEFYWWGSMSGPIENAVASTSSGNHSSKVLLSPEDMIDGEILECVVSDGSGTDVTVSWTLVVNQ